MKPPPARLGLDPQAGQELVEALSRVGFFEFVPPAEVSAVRADAIGNLCAGGFWLWDRERPGSLDRHNYSADGEYLWEEGFDRVFEDAADVLSRLGVRVPLMEFYPAGMPEHGGRWMIGLDGELLELAADGEPDEGPCRWQLAHECCAGLLSTLLERASAQHRGYCVWHDNDAQIAILTPQQAKLIRDAPIDPIEQPYGPGEPFPWEGD